MKKLRIALVETKSPAHHIYRMYLFPRGVVLLATIMKHFLKNMWREGWLRSVGYEDFEIKVFYEDTREIDWSFIGKCSFVFFSTITCTAPATYKYAVAIKERWPHICTAVGGIHVSFLPEEAFKEGKFDYVFRGEGEIAIMDFLSTKLGIRGELPRVSGLYWQENSRLVSGPETMGKQMDMDDLLIPDFNLVDGFQLGLVVPVQTARGCPYNCRFCSVIQMFGRQCRFRSIENVVREVRTHKPKRKEVFFTDDNFTAQPERTIALLNAIMADSHRNLSKGFVCQVHAADSLRHPELVKVMAKSGCKRVQVGFESINPKTLKSYKKKQSVPQIKQAIKRFHDAGIGIHGMFVFGGDDDTSETISETVAFSREMKLESVQFMILTPLPGTPLYSDFSSEGRIICSDWSRFDGHHVVFQPKQMSPYELQQLTNKAHEDFYSEQQIRDRRWGLINPRRGCGGSFVKRFYDLKISQHAHALAHSFSRNNQSYRESLPR